MKFKCIFLALVLLLGSISSSIAAITCEDEISQQKSCLEIFQEAQAKEYKRNKTILKISFYVAVLSFGFSLGSVIINNFAMNSATKAVFWGGFVGGSFVNRAAQELGSKHGRIIQASTGAQSRFLNKIKRRAPGATAESVAAALGAGFMTGALCNGNQPRGQKEVISFVTGIINSTPESAAN